MVSDFGVNLGPADVAVEYKGASGLFSLLRPQFLDVMVLKRYADSTSCPHVQRIMRP